MLIDWIILAATFVLQFILIPKPQNAKPASLDDFDVPVVEEGKELGVLSGTEMLKGPNVTWWGDLKITPIKGARRYGFFGPRQVTGYYYSLGMQMVLCAGPADVVTEIWVGDKLAWEGLNTGGSAFIFKPDLFGGEDREGGIVGFVDICMGEPTQDRNSYLAQEHVLGANCSAYRGVVTVVLRQVYLGITPYIKPWAFKVQRIHTRSNNGIQWYDATAEIRRGSPPRHYLIPATHFADPVASDNHVVDMVNTTIVRVGTTVRTLEIYDILSGNLLVRIFTDHDIFNIIASRPTNEVLTWGEDGNMHVYDAVTGVLKEVVIGPPQNNAFNYRKYYTAGLREVDGVTYYVASWAIYIYCFANDGSGWNQIWGGFRGFYFGGFFNSIAMSDDLLYCPHGDGHFSIYEWSPLGLGNHWYAPKWSYNPPLGVAGPPQILPGYYGLQYIDEYDCVILAVRGGYVYKLNHDMSQQLEVVNDSALWNGGNLFANYQMSNALQSGPNRITFYAHASFGGTRCIVEYTIEPLVRISFYPEPYWDNNVDQFTNQFSMASKIYHAILLSGGRYGTTAQNKDHVYFFGGAFDMNPSHIIREYLTDHIWGMGYNDADIDNDAFTYAADLFFDEEFGLTIWWVRQEVIEEMITIILAHCNAVLFTSRKTGKFILKPIRNDYVLASLPIFDDSDVVEWTEVKRRQPNDAITSITVQYTDRVIANSEDGSATYQNDAQIQQSGGIIQDNRSYPGISHFSLAHRVAERDQHPFNAGMIDGSFTGTRRFQELNPGSPFRLLSERHNLDGAVMRVVDMRFSAGKENTITIKFIQDLFRLGAEALVDETTETWTRPGSDPQIVDPRLVWEAPYFELLRLLGDADVANMLSGDPDFGMLEVAAEQPTGDTFRILIYVNNVNNDILDTFSPAGFLSADITTFQTAVTIDSAVDFAFIEDGMLAAFVEADPAKVEIVQIISHTGSSLVLSRGMVDTIPQPHLAGTDFIVFEDFGVVDPVVRTAGDVTIVKLLSQTPLGTLNINSAPVDTLTMASRAVRPLRPADVRVEGLTEGPVDGTLLTDFDVTWKNRNRLTELTTFNSWVAATVTPEAGQTTVIEVLASDGITVLETYSGLTGTSYTVPATAFDTAHSGWIRVGAERDGYREWQAYKIRVLLAASLLLSGDQQTNGDHVALSGDQAPGNEHLS